MSVQWYAVTRWNAATHKFPTKFPPAPVRVEQRAGLVQQAGCVGSSAGDADHSVVAQQGLHRAWAAQDLKRSRAQVSQGAPETSRPHTQLHAKAPAAAAQQTSSFKMTGSSRWWEPVCSAAGQPANEPRYTMVGGAPTSSRSWRHSVGSAMECSTSAPHTSTTRGGVGGHAPAAGCRVGGCGGSRAGSG